MKLKPFLSAASTIAADYQLRFKSVIPFIPFSAIRTLCEDSSRVTSQELLAAGWVSRHCLPKNGSPFQRYLRLNQKESETMWVPAAFAREKIAGATQAKPVKVPIGSTALPVATPNTDLAFLVDGLKSGRISDEMFLRLVKAI